MMINNDVRSADVVVVGAGYAGLRAARQLRDAGLAVLVLESAGRVGGRTLTDRVDGGWALDLGGQWIGPGHTRLAALAERFGAATFSSPHSGDALFDDGRTSRRFTGDLPPMAPHVAAAVAFAIWRLERLARRVDVSHPWASPHAARHDAETVGAWLRRNVPVTRARQLLGLAIEAELCTDADDASLLGLLTMIRGTGGLGAAVTTEGGALQELFVDGADGPARSMADELGDDVRLNSAVSSIEQTTDGVVLAGTFGRVCAGRAIVAIPPTLAGRISYDPPLPAARDQLTQRMPMGSILKTVAIYDRPFWRDDGLVGQAVSLDGPVRTTFDVSQPGGPGYLCALVPGRAARQLAALSDVERRGRVVRAFTHLYGPRAAQPDDWREKMWDDDPNVRGGYGAYFPPGVLTSVGRALRAPVGRIHWAGTETATEWAGYIEGAVRSGERAADEVLAACDAPFHRRSPQPVSTQPSWLPRRVGPLVRWS